MVVAIAEIGVQTGRLTREVSTTIVGAGLLSVLLFPTAANALLAREAYGVCHGTGKYHLLMELWIMACNRLTHAI